MLALKERKSKESRNKYIRAVYKDKDYLRMSPGYNSARTNKILPVNRTAYARVGKSKRILTDRSRIEVEKKGNGRSATRGTDMGHCSMIVRPMRREWTGLFAPSCKGHVVC
jgi:hypothetical protein